MKSGISDLRIAGGQPLFTDTLHVGRPNIGDRTKLHALWEDMLSRRWLSNSGPYVQQLEHRIAEYLGVDHCITVVNATAGLELLARALGLKGEVIMPAFTFVATAHAFRWLGITPKFGDIDEQTHNIDPGVINGLINAETAAVLGVHVWGRPCNTDALEEVCRARRIPLIYDAAHAFGCSRQGKMIGGFGSAEVFSFHATKFFNTFEGGAITTNDADLANRILLMRNFGFSGYDNVLSLGVNAKMHEATAAMGLVGMDALPEFIETNRRNHNRYRSGLTDIAGVKIIEYSTLEKNNYQYVILEIDEGIAGLSRDLLVRILHAENVLARRYFYPGCHRMPPYNNEDPYASQRLSRTESLASRVLSLPTGTAVHDEQIDAICSCIRFCVKHAPEIRTLSGPV